MNRTETLEAAQSVVTGRGRTHGEPENSFRDIARHWSIILGVEVRPHQVALCMTAMKIVRAGGNPDNPDNWIDQAGYAACGAEVRDHE